ncbi:MAG: formylglycine-generating enzyme family protein [Kiritimatiellia bacterium]
MHPDIKNVFVAIALVTISSFNLQAGTLEPTSPPAPSMYTLEEIYQKVSFLGPAQTLSATTTAILAGYYNSTSLDVIDADLVASNIRSGVVIFGITGTYIGDSTTNQPPPAPAGMSLIPAGEFVMGDTFGEGGSDELPLHTNTISAFYMDKYEVTKALWEEVKAFTGSYGYTYSNTGLGKATNHPVHTVNWFDVVKWCNARSQRDGLAPVYYTDAGFTTVYKTGEIAPFANWSANGYRLPTEAEWEKAARGGLAAQRFPWGDTISHSNANYYAYLSGYSYDVNPTEGYHPIFNIGNQPYTSPVGYFAPNGYGLYDMSGNVWEWCWDWYSSSYYSSSPSTDPRGPSSGSYRVLRGGSWIVTAYVTRVAIRDYYYLPDVESYAIGFRCARGL